jgi:large subunit ribosomal protein L31
VKPGIHPIWYADAVVTCACGNSWTTGSTKKEIHTDVCNKCHPFFTGEQRIVDTAGQVERFMKRISAKEQIAASQPAPEEKKSKKEKRRDHKVVPTAEAPAPRPPAELPLALAERQPILPAVAEMPETPIASEPVDKIIEPTGVSEPGPDAEMPSQEKASGKPGASRKAAGSKPRTSAPKKAKEEPKEEPKQE